MQYATQYKKLDLKNLAYQKSLSFNPAQMVGVQSDGTRHPVVYPFTDEARRPVFLPDGCTRLEISGEVRISSDAMRPHHCNGKEAFERTSALADTYRALGGFSCLAAGYVENFANGRFSRKNGLHVERETTELAFMPDRSTGAETVLAFDASSLERGELLGIDAVKAAMTTGSPSDLDALVATIAATLSRKRGEPKGSGGHTLKYRWTADMAPGAQVYPDIGFASSEAGGLRLGFIREGSIAASIHAIDTWHGDLHYGAISINAHGAIHRDLKLRGKGQAAPSLRMLANEFERLESDAGRGVLTDDLHFFMANLVRGFVLEKV